LRLRCIHSRVVVDRNPRIRQQHPRGFFCGPRHRGIVAHEILGDRAIDQQGELGRERFGGGDAKLLQQVAKPQAPALLERDRDPAD
jgi:hypothetical protein